MNAVRDFRGHRLSSWQTTLGIAITFLALGSPLTAADKGPTRQSNLPDAREVAFGGPLGEAYDRGVKRLALPPYDSAVYLRPEAP